MKLAEKATLTLLERRKNLIRMMRNKKRIRPFSAMMMMTLKKPLIRKMLTTTTLPIFQLRLDVSGMGQAREANTPILRRSRLSHVVDVDADRVTENATSDNADSGDPSLRSL